MMNQIVSKWSRLRVLAVVLPLAAAILATGCDDITVGTREPAVGNWSLISIDNQSLPVIVDHGNIARREVFSGGVSIHPDGSFSDRIHFRNISGSSVVFQSDTIVGTFARVGNTITFRSAKTGFQWNGSISGRTMTQIRGDTTLVYHR